MLTINGELETGSTKAVYLSTNDNITDKTLNDLVKVNDNVTFAIDAEGNKVVAEASLNGVNYASLNDALESAQAGQTVKLLTDVKVAGVEALNGGLFVNDGVTLDGNNKKITVTGKVSGIVLNGTSTLKNVTVENDENGKYNVQAYMGEATIENVTIVDNSEGFAGILVNGGNAVLKGVKYAGQSTSIIELGIGSGITTTPKVTIDGEITSTNEDVSVVYVDKNQLKDVKLDDVLVVTENASGMITSDTDLELDENGNVVITTPWTPIEPADPVVPMTPLEPSKPVVPMTPLEPADPVVPMTPLEPSEPVEDETTDNPDTGDKNNIAIYTSMAAAALCGVAIIALNKKREELMK